MLSSTGLSATGLSRGTPQSAASGRATALPCIGKPRIVPTDTADGGPIHRAHHLPGGGHMA